MSAYYVMMAASENDDPPEANPFNVDPSFDFPAPVVAEPGWSENMFFQSYDPATKSGIFTHIGRHRLDPLLWRAVLAIYRPDGVVYVARSFGRAIDERGPAAGNLQVTCVEAHKRWRLGYDGAAEGVRSTELAAGFGGAGPTEPISFDLAYEAVGPVYDMFASADLGDQDWGHLHHEQAFAVSGVISIAGSDTRVGGMGYRDHSVGKRDLSNFGGNKMIYAVSERGRIIEGIEAYDRDGKQIHADAHIIEDGRFERMGLTSLPDLDHASGTPSTFAAVFERNGEPFTVTGEVLHSAAFTIGDPNDWSVGVNGTDKNPLIIVESPVRLILPGGDIAYGNLERNRRWSAIG